MSSIYRSIHEYAFAVHKEAFSALLDGFKRMSVDFFLIGAQARDVHFFQQGIRPMRATRDIDFAVMVDSMEQYRDLIKYLTQVGFEKTQDPYRLQWKLEKTVIDLLPFGQLEENYTVNFDERDIELSVLGYRELNDEAQQFYIDEAESVSIPVSPLHGLFLLKLLAWDEKKPGREKDLGDLNQILNNYWDFVEDEAYEDHQDLFDDDFEMGKASARILGRHMSKTLNKSAVLRARVQQIIVEQLASTDPPGLMLQKFASDSDKPIDSVKLLLDEILKGIND